MDPADSNRLPRVRFYSGARREGSSSRVRDCHPLWSPFPGLFRLPKPCSLPLIKESLVLQPRPDESRRFGLGPVRSPLLGPSRLLSFPGGTEMFQFPPFAPAAYGLGGGSFRDPGLIAVFHALHRLPAPRHPPHALGSLAAPTLPPRKRKPGRHSCSTGPSGA